MPAGACIGTGSSAGDADYAESIAVYAKAVFFCRENAMIILRKVSEISHIDERRK